MNRAAIPDGSVSEWLDLYGDALYRKALSVVRNKATAEDLVQDTFVAALKGKTSFNGDSSIETWLFSILRNKTIDYFRAVAKSQQVFDQNICEEEDREHFNVFGFWKEWRGFWGTSGDVLIESKGLAEQLQKCISKLPESYRLFLKLKFGDEKNTAELCKELGITETNAWVLLYRLRMKLRVCMDKNWFNV